MSYIWEFGFQIEQGLNFRLISTMMASLKSLWLIVLDQAIVDFICFSSFFMFLIPIFNLAYKMQ